MAMLNNQMVRWLKNHLPLTVIFVGQRETDGFLHVAMWNTGN